MDKFNKFKIGDIIIPTRETNGFYGVTCEINKCVCSVVEIYDEHDIKVKIIENTNEYEINETYTVDSRYFTLKEAGKVLRFIKGKMYIAKREE